MAAVDVRRAVASLSHRGPDGVGFLCRPSIEMGMCRLAVIDLITGGQPVSNEKEDVWAILNGEIYNHRALRDQLAATGHLFRAQSDTEVLPHLYEHDGLTGLAQISGMFAFALWDASRDTLILARDRFGEKPLYLARLQGGGVLFASELKAIRVMARDAGISLTLSAQAVYDYLSLGYIPQPATIYNEVECLQPGHIVTFTRDSVSTTPYWKPSPVAPTNVSYREAVARTRTLVSNAVAKRLESDVPLGVLLSGGIDSAIVTYEAARLQRSRVRTFTVGVDDRALDERGLAAKTASALGVQNTQLNFRLEPAADLQALIRTFDQPFADSSALIAAAVCREARKHVTVVLTGDGGDELFGGYRRYLAARAAGIGFLGDVSGVLSSLLRHARAGRRSSIGFATRYARGMKLDAGARYLAWTGDMLKESDKRSAWRGGDVRPTEDLVQTFALGATVPLDAQRTIDIALNLSSDLLVKMDIASMASSLEARAAFLDEDIFEFTASLPASVLLRHWRLKPLLRDAYADVLPTEVVQAPKRGFEVPMASWLRGDLRPLIGDCLISGVPRLSEFIDPAFVRMVASDDHPRDINHTYVLFSLLILEMWLRIN